MTSKSENIIGQLVQQAQMGDEFAIGKIIELTQDSLLRFCIYLTGSIEKANDLRQESYVRALENIKKLKDPNAFMSWLFKTTKNQYLNHIKSSKNRGHVNFDELGEQILIQNSTDQETILNVRKIMAELEPEERSVVLLVHLEGYSYAEAAEIIGISESDVRNELHRLRQSFLKMRRKDKL